MTSLFFRIGDGVFIFLCIVFMGHLFYPEYVPAWLHDFSPKISSWLNKAGVGYLIFFPLLVGMVETQRLAQIFKTTREKRSFFWVPYALTSFKWLISIVLIIVLMSIWDVKHALLSVLAFVIVFSLFSEIVNGFFGMLCVIWEALPAAYGDYDTSLKRAAFLSKYNVRGDFLYKETILIDAGRLSEARSSCENLLPIVTEPYKRHCLLSRLALIEIGSGNFKQAQELLEASAVCGGELTMPSVYSNLALALLEQGICPDMALKNVELAIQRRNFFNKLSIQSFIQHVFLDLELGKRHLLSAWALSVLQDYDRSDSFIQLARPLMKSKRKADYSFECYLLGRTLLAQGKGEEGMDWIRKASGIPGFASILAKRFLLHAQ